MRSWVGASESARSCATGSSATSRAPTWHEVTGEPGVLRGLVHTGLEAAIVEGGTIRVGDRIEPVD